MSVRERRNRKDGRAKTPDELHRGRCSICMGKIRRGQPVTVTVRGSGMAHENLADCVGALAAEQAGE